MNTSSDLPAPPQFHLLFAFGDTKEGGGPWSRMCQRISGIGVVDVGLDRFYLFPGSDTLRPHRMTDGRRTSLQAANVVLLITMLIPESIREFVELVDAYSGHRLKEKEYLCILLQLAWDASEPALVGDLAFHGKYLSRLYETVRRESMDSEAYPKLRDELTAAAEEFSSRLRTLVAHTTPETQDRMHLHFFSLTGQSFTHLLALAGDFEYLKNWELDFERGGTGGG